MILSHDMFLAMMLINAKRAEAIALTLTVEREKPRIEMRLTDGSSQALHAPPSEILIKIIESLEQKQMVFSSNVHIVTIQDVQTQRENDKLMAHISRWNIELVASD